MPDSLRDLPDVNVLVALTIPDHEFHAGATRWFQETTRFATTPVTEMGLVRLLLNPAVSGQRLGGAFVRSILGSVRADLRHTFVPDASSLAEPAVDLVALEGHQHVTDLHLLNLAVGAAARLVTFDRRIQGLVPGLDSGSLVTL